MKGFALDNNGDVIIEKNKIKMIDGVDLINQTVKTVLGTNKTEWFLNVDGGIEFNNLWQIHRVCCTMDDVCAVVCKCSSGLMCHGVNNT